MMPVLKIILSLGYSDRCAVTSLFQRFATVQTDHAIVQKPLAEEDAVLT
jgi:hypothetical protein